MDLYQLELPIPSAAKAVGVTICWVNGKTTQQSKKPDNGWSFRTAIVLAVRNEIKAEQILFSPISMRTSRLDGTAHELIFADPEQTGVSEILVTYSTE